MRGRAGAGDGGGRGQRRRWAGAPGPAGVPGAGGLRGLHSVAGSARGTRRTPGDSRCRQPGAPLACASNSGRRDRATRAGTGSPPAALGPQSGPGVPVGRHRPPVPALHRPALGHLGDGSRCTGRGRRTRGRETASCPGLAAEPRGRPGPTKTTGSKARQTLTRPGPRGTRPRGQLHKMVAARSRQPPRAHAPHGGRPARAEVA